LVSRWDWPEVSADLAAAVGEVLELVIAESMLNCV